MVLQLREELERIQKLIPVSDLREIQYGIQFSVTYENQKGTLRLFYGKKGLTRDYSPIKDEVFLSWVRGMIEGSSATLPSQKKEEKSPCLKSEEAIFTGSDESGKGDYFGPLVTAAVYIPSQEVGEELLKLGIKDSKQMTDSKVLEVAPLLLQKAHGEVSILGGEHYNRQYERINNLNHLLAEEHAKVAEKLHQKYGIDKILVDQFASGDTIPRAFRARFSHGAIQVFQRPKAEDHIAVAAASVVARFYFLKEMEELKKAYSFSFPLGAGSLVLEGAKEFAKIHGKEALYQVAKVHFKTTDQIES